MRVLLFVGLVFLVAIVLAGPVLGSMPSTTHAERVPGQATPTATATSTATTTPSITLTATASPSPTSTATGTTTPSGVYLPLILRDDYVPSPTPTSTVPAPTNIRNGDFEDGNQDWTEESRQGFRIIVHRDELPEELGVDPNSGDWAAWLGGAPNELAAVNQAVTIPGDRPHISYWIWIGSEDWCEHDIGGLGLAYGEDEFEGLDIYWLCEDNNTGGWINRTVSAADFVGQEVELWILAETDGTWNSNLFVDDVAFVSSGTATAPHRLNRTQAGPRISGKLADMADRIRGMSPTR